MELFHFHLAERGQKVKSAKFSTILLKGRMLTESSEIPDLSRSVSPVQNGFY